MDNNNYNPIQDNHNEINDSAFVDSCVVMGTGNVIMEGVIIRAGVKIGDNNYFGPYCIIGDDAEKVGWFGKPGKILIGNGNRFTKQVTVDRGTESETVIGDRVMMLKNAHVGHDAIIMNDVVLSCNVCVGGHTVIGNKSNLGLGAVVHQRLMVPMGTLIGMNTTVTKKTEMREAGMTYVGSPAVCIGFNKKFKGS